MLLSAFLEETAMGVAQTQPGDPGLIDAFTADLILFVIVGVIVLTYLVSLGYFLYKLIRKYTLGNWDENNKNPFEGETLAMPRGTFRGILTFSLLFIIIVLEVVSLRMPLVEIGGKLISLEDKIDQLMVAFQMMIAFYFGSKVMHHLTSADERKTEEMAKATTAVATENASASKPAFDESGSVG